MTYHEKALKRLNTLKGHVNPGIDAERETRLGTFDLKTAQTAFWRTLPEHYFDVFEVISELP